MGNRRSQSWWQTLRSSWRSWLLPVAMLVLLGGGYAIWMSPSGEISVHYGQFKQLVRDGNVKSVEMADKEISGELYQSVEGEHGRQGTRFHTARAGILEDPTLIPLLEEKGVEFRGAAPAPIWQRSFELMFPLLILGALLWFLLFRMEGPGSAFGFSRSRAKLHVQDARGVRFDGVAGLEEAVEELLEVVDFLRTPEKYQEIGGRIPKGVLLVGPPGTGKTLLARAVAGEANVPFLSMSGSDFVELFVGVGAARVRDLFKQALSHAPCIIFIDELDALGKARGVNVAGGGHEEREQTLNQLLVEMDGFDVNKGVVLMAATNRPEILDAALLRPGRFDRTVVVDRPDVQGREKILRIHASTVRIADQVDLRAVAGLTPGFVGADLANLVNEAALLAARHGSPLVETRHFEEAIERGYVGLARKNRVMLPEEKRRIAYHECGHAIVSHALPTADPVHKISIIPRGVGAGGYVLHLPTEDRFLRTEDELRARLAVLLGGVTAEELVFGNVSTGPSNDYEHVSRVARSMVCRYGMSKNLGRMAYGPAQGSFLGHAEAGGPVEYSPTTAARIDEEVRTLVQEAGRVARAILEDRRDAMDRLAALLLEKEVLDASQLHDVMAWVADPATPVPPSADSKGDDPIAGSPKPAGATPGDAKTANGPKLGDAKGFVAAS